MAAQYAVLPRVWNGVATVVTDVCIFIALCINLCVLLVAANAVELASAGIARSIWQMDLLVAWSEEYSWVTIADHDNPEFRSRVRESLPDPRALSAFLNAWN